VKEEIEGRLTVTRVEEMDGMKAEIEVSGPFTSVGTTTVKK